MGIKYASSKVQPLSQEPVPWAGTITNNQDEVHGLVSQHIWDKTQRIIAELTHMDLEDSEGMHWDSMESIIGFLIYVAKKYREMNPYFKGIYLTLDSWIPYIHKEGWKLRGGDLNIATLDGKWGGAEEVNKPNLVIGVPRLRGYLLVLGRLTKEKVPSVTQLTVQR